MQQHPELMGRLTIRLFVAIAEDQHGRIHGAWKTLASHFLHRDDVPATIARFNEINPGLLTRENIDIGFVTREHFPAIGFVGRQ